tara:strand:- start:84 stop:305 length:222 start_codon:yes stop_codon:yes gene_type:complete
MPAPTPSWEDFKNKEKQNEKLRDYKLRMEHSKSVLSAVMIKNPTYTTKESLEESYRIADEIMALRKESFNKVA